MKLAVIPVRLAATRLPGKPLLDLGGRSIVQWVYDATRSAGVFDDVVVATPDDEIAETVRGFGGHVERTKESHLTGGDRVAEVASRRADASIVANVQGDQPFVTATMLELLIAPFAEDPSIEVTTLGCPVAEAAVADPNSVKVVTSRTGRALYFSRATIPHGLTAVTAAELPVLHHIGLYAFRASALQRFAGMDPTPLERQERLEQLRLLENDLNVHVARAEAPIIEINTEEDLAAARAQVAGQMR